jgi:pimeloyl-ACP methyl ester carboxylesterase
VSIGEHAADAAALLDHLGIARAHIAGHSSGAAVAAELALRSPEVVQSLVLLELSLLSMPSGAAFFQQAGPALEAYAAGDSETAVAAFLSVVSGMDWTTARAMLESKVPGMAAQTIKDADTFFGVELPALTRWTFGPEQAGAITQPILSVLGALTQPLWHEVADFLRSSAPHVEDCTIDGVGHLLHLQNPEPVALAISNFLARHALTAI